jgi:hypothetical protein
MRKPLILTTFFLVFHNLSTLGQSPDLSKLSSPILFKGDEHTAYRDPAILFHADTFYLYFTLVEIEESGYIYSYTAQSRSRDLLKWSRPEKITPRDQSLNFSSPGNLIRFRNEWILCLQTYPRKGYTMDQMPRYGDENSRIYTMRSKDLRSWSTPKVIAVKGEDTPVSKMGRMIDPYIIEDKDAKGKYWCFYKQNGVSLSYSDDLINWTFFGSTRSGENVCVITEGNEYILFHSPQNGIGVKRSNYLINWKDEGLITLGQDQWEWAKGRITAGTVLKIENNLDYKYIMFFHGSGPLTEDEGDFDKNSSIGIAWSKDLQNWDWPGKTTN